MWLCLHRLDVNNYIKLYYLKVNVFRCHSFVCFTMLVYIYIYICLLVELVFSIFVYCYLTEIKF